MAVPDGVERARRHQVYGLLPLPKQPLVGGEALEGFTGRMKRDGKVVRAADGACLKVTLGPLGHAALP